MEYKRLDFSVRNSRGLAVKGSVWELITPRLGDSESCILYLHPNSGSRVDVVKTRIMSVAATAKCTVCSFDFAGCGNSEGDHVSEQGRGEDITSHHACVCCSAAPILFVLLTDMCASLTPRPHCLIGCR